MRSSRRNGGAPLLDIGDKIANDRGTATYPCPDSGCGRLPVDLLALSWAHTQRQNPETHP